jgi:putative NIF3 family GTP cyclohydrolase 1 type 2
VTVAIAKAHSYEEPAIDVYPLRIEPSEAGIGRVATFAKPRRLGDFVRTVKRVLGLRTVSFAGDPEKAIERVAVCTGGGNTLGDAVVAAGCQAYLCGELKYHEAEDLASRGIGVILGGHYETERVPLDFWAEKLEDEIPGVEVVMSRTERPTMAYM